MLNNVNLCGRLVKDPELKSTTSGTSVATFTLAVDRDYTSGEEKQADFINCVAWKGTAEFVSKYFVKGKMMILNGTLQVRNYDAQDGTKRYVTEVIARNVYFAGDKPNGDFNGNFERNQAKPDEFISVENDDYNSDLPF